MIDVITKKLRKYFHICRVVCVQELFIDLVKCVEAKMSCVECGKHSNYKCPTCRQPYCSVACCKKHKKSPCEVPPQLQPTEPEEKNHYEFPTEDTVSPDKLKLLGESTELKQCLGNHNLRDLLKILDNSQHPDSLIQEYMQEPIFTEFVDACLKVVQPPEEGDER